MSRPSAGGDEEENARFDSCPVRPAAKPLVIAHRGASADAPENTLASFRLAWAQGADAIEGDFRLTADGQVVCVHDADFRRFGHGVTVADHPLADLRQFDIGSWKSPAYARERVATLADVLALIPPGKHLRLEIKARRQPLPAIIEVLDRLAIPADHVRLMSFDAETIRNAKTLCPRFRTDWLIEYPPGRPVPSAEAVIATLRSARADGLGTEGRPDVVTPSFGHAIRHAGFELGAWTINTVDLARTLLAAGVTAITTDRPGMMKRLLVP